VREFNSSTRSRLNLSEAGKAEIRISKRETIFNIKLSKMHHLSAT